MVQDYRQMNISAGAWVATREFPLSTGEADYLLYADGKAIGVVEAKPEGYNPDNRHRRRQAWTEKNPEGRWRSFDYDELIKRDKVNLDIFWLKDKSLEDSDDLPDPDVLAQEIVDDMQTALDQFGAVLEGLKE